MYSTDIKSDKDMILIMIIMLIMGTLISMSSNSWFSMWVGLELNLIGFIKMIMKNKSSYLIECSMKYFIIQVFSSFMFITFMLEMINVFYFKMNIIIIIINLMMLMKMGFSPFHLWLINLFNLMPWNMMIILMTWQKLTPMWLMSIYTMKKSMMMMIIIINMIMSMMGLMNQTNLKKFFLYSSLNHNSWMLSSLLFNKYWWINYLIGYTFILLTMMMNLNNYNLNNVNNLSNTNLNYWIKKLMMINLLSMSGLPPFMGFIMKWYLIMKIKFMLLIIMMMMLTSINIYFYVKIMFYSVISVNNNNNSKMNWWININWLSLIWLFM